MKIKEKNPNWKGGISLDTIQYYKDFWKKNPEKYEKHKENMKNYQKTEKGKESNKKAKEKFKQENPNYLKDYMRRRQKEAKEKGICPRCLKNEKREKYDSCEECAKRYQKYWRKRNEKKVHQHS